MSTIYNNILTSIKSQEKLLAVLIDPDKMKLDVLSGFMGKLNKSIATHIFVGGSEVNRDITHILVRALKKMTTLPIILFPGDVTQITNSADALLFLSLISGRNPDYLIDKHIQAASILKDSELEVIPTGYVLIENGKETSVQRVTQTQPMPRNDIQKIVNTAYAGQLLGQKLMYLEAGSGATNPVNVEIISEVRQVINIPLIVGGGIKSPRQLSEAYQAGADMIVIGTAFEENESFFLLLKK